MLDRSRLSTARIRERLAQGQARMGADATLNRMAVAWVEGAMLWQIDGGRGLRDLVYLDADGQPSAAPPAYPVSEVEAGIGFARTQMVLGPVVEAH